MKRTQDQISQADDDAGAAVKRQPIKYVMLLNDQHQDILHRQLVEGANKCEQSALDFVCMIADPIALTVNLIEHATIIADATILVNGDFDYTAREVFLENFRPFCKLFNKYSFHYEAMHLCQSVRIALLKKIPLDDVSFFRQMIISDYRLVAQIPNAPLQFWKWAVKLSEDAIALCPNPCEDLCYEAVHHFPLSIRHIKNPDTKCIDEAIRGDGRALAHIDPRFRTQTWCIAAVYQCDEAIGAVPLLHKSAAYKALSHKYKDD